MSGYGKHQELDYPHQERRGYYKRDDNDELVKRIAGLTAYKIQQNQEAANKKILRDFMLIAITLIVGLVVGYHRGKGLGF
jgi:hypothetical protein